MTDAAGGSPPGGTGRSTWPVVGLALVVVGLLAGGGVVLARGGTSGSESPAVTPTASLTPSPAPTLADAQLAGAYDVRLVVRTAHNLATLAGIDAPVPGMHGSDRWRFYPTCASPDYPCATSWEGHDPPLTPAEAFWTAMVAGPPATCRQGRHVEAPIGFRLRTVAGEATGDGWVVQSFFGTWTIAFRCPGFARSRGTVEITGHRH